MRAVKKRGTARGQHAGLPAEAGELVSLSRARDELGLDYDEFEVALQVGEVRTVVCGPGVWKVPRAELARLRAAEGHPDTLLERLRLVSSGGAAEVMGISRERFVRLARAGCVRPVRWYVNQYRVVVWLYLAREAAEFAAGHPGVLSGRLPVPQRGTADAPADLRARGWRARRAEQLVRDAADAWEEAAVWAALLGPAITAEAVPDPFERARLRRLRTALPSGRPGRATAEQVRSITTADAPDEVAAGLVALAEALGRARAASPEPRPAAVPPPVPPPTGSPGTRRGLRRLLGRRTAAREGRPAPAGPGRDGQSSPTSVSRITARPSSSDAARSTSAEMPQP